MAELVEEFDMAQRTCDVEGCDRKHQARGMCRSHWSAWYRQQFKEAGNRSHHPSHLRTCATCGAEWYTPRAEAKFCTAKCKGVYLSERNRRTSKLPADHPVMVLIEARKPKPKPKPEPFAESRECAWCGDQFTATIRSQVFCSSEHKVKAKRNRRRGREYGSTSHYTWAEFMRVLAKFDRCCAYCERPIEGQADPDHVVPLSKGGSNSITNILPSCRPCNSDKRDLLLHEWALDRERLGKPSRVTAWPASDPRIVHLTDALLVSPAA